MKVGIVGQRDNERAADLVASLRRTLLAEEVEVWIDETTAAALSTAGVAVDRMVDCDLVVSVGGDGTFLYAARAVGTTPVMGVNLGEVGFLNAVTPEDAIDVVTAEVERLRESGSIDTRTIARLSALGRDWSLDPAINEIVVQGGQRGHGNGATFAVSVDDSEFTKTHADGVLIATPTGSTAYNLSEGGPLLHHDIDALVVTEMCPADPMPSLVVDGGCTIDVRIADAETGYVISDGRTRQPLDPPATVTVERTGRPVRLAGPRVDFFTALDKLD